MALDLGKSKRAGCVYDTQTHEHRFDSAREDYVFAGLQTMSRSNAAQAAVINLLPSGAARVSGRAYLATYAVRMPRNATGSVSLTVEPGGRTLLYNALSQPLIFSGSEATIASSDVGRPDAPNAAIKPPNH